MDQPPLPLPSDHSPLRLVGSVWDYVASADERAGSSIITVPQAKIYEPLFTAGMLSSAIMAMECPMPLLVT